MYTSTWEEREGATHSDQAAEGSFIGRDQKAGFRSQGRALPGREDEVRIHPGRSGDTPSVFGGHRETCSWITISGGAKGKQISKETHLFSYY